MYLALIVILILVSGLCVMAEMAFVSSRRGRLQARADRGDVGARVALDLIEHPTRYLSTIQIAITLAAIGLGMFGEASVTARFEQVVTELMEDAPAMHTYVHAIALGLTGLLLTFATLLFGELVPKRLGQMYPEAIARVFSRPMDLVGRVASPLVHVLAWLTNVIVKLVPFRTARDEDGAEEEVRAIIASGTEAGVFHRSEQELVDRVFRISDQRVTAIMVPRTDIDFLNVDDSIERVRVTVATSPHSHFAVCGKNGLDELIGVVHVKDLVKHGLISDTVHLRDLAQPPVFVPESTIVIRLLERIRKTGVHMVFVVDEYGAVLGLVTLNDVIGALIGEVSIGGLPEPMVVKRHDGSLLVDGQLPTQDLKKLMRVDGLPGEDTAGYETLGGFVMTHLGRIPATGDRFTYNRFEFEVVDMDRTRVDKVLLTEKTQPSSEPSTDDSSEA